MTIVFNPGQVLELLEEGADPNVRDEHDDSALMLASKFGEKDLVRTLLDKGASIDAQDKDGWSALILASWRNHREVVRMLLEAGAKPNLHTKTSLQMRLGDSSWLPDATRMESAL